MLSICIGSWMNIALADQDVGTLLTNWFNNKQSESIQEIDKAIKDEKEILLKQLKEE